MEQGHGGCGPCPGTWIRPSQGQLLGVICSVLAFIPNFDMLSCSSKSDSYLGNTDAGKISLSFTLTPSLGGKFPLDCRLLLTVLETT